MHPFRRLLQGSKCLWHSRYSPQDDSGFLLILPNFFWCIKVPWVLPLSHLFPLRSSHDTCSDFLLWPLNSDYSLGYFYACISKYLEACFCHGRYLLLKEVPQGSHFVWSIWIFFHLELIFFFQEFVEGKFKKKLGNYSNFSFMKFNIGNNYFLSWKIRLIVDCPRLFKNISLPNWKFPLACFAFPDIFNFEVQKTFPAIFRQIDLRLQVWSTTCDASGKFTRNLGGGVKITREQTFRIWFAGKNHLYSNETEPASFIFSRWIFSVNSPPAPPPPSPVVTRILTPTWKQTLLWSAKIHLCVSETITPPIILHINLKPMEKLWQLL